MPPNINLNVSRYAKTHEKFYGADYYRFAIGQAPFSVPDTVAEALREHAHCNDYTEPAGIEDLRNAIAIFHARKDDLRLPAENIIVGPGSKELIYILQLVLDQPVLIPSPCWMSYPLQAAYLGRKFNFLPTRYQDGWKLDPDRLARATRDGKPRTLILNSPNNPTGACYEHEELSWIAHWCRQNNITVISDEIYARFNPRFRSFAHYLPEATIVVSGLSKWAGLGGWRLGTALFPPNLAEVQDAVNAVARESYSSVAHPLQKAAIAAYTMPKGEYEQRLEKIEWYNAITRTCQTMIQSFSSCYRPDGGYYLFPIFNKGTLGLDSSEELVAYLNERKVGVLPGPALHFPDTEYTISCRIALVEPIKKCIDGMSILRDAIVERMNV